MREHETDRAVLSNVVAERHALRQVWSVAENLSDSSALLYFNTLNFEEVSNKVTVVLLWHSGRYKK
jgi:hypothetical protein